MARETVKPRTVRRARGAKNTAERAPDSAEELVAEGAAMCDEGLSDGAVARLAGAWGNAVEAGDGSYNIAAPFPGGIELADIEAMLSSRHQRAESRGYREGRQQANREWSARERFIRREVLLGAFTMWRAELEQILKVASRAGASADVRRKEALDALVEHTADVARQHDRLAEEAWGE